MVDQLIMYMFHWNYAFKVFMRKYWGDKYRTIPVFVRDLPDDMLGDFAHTISGLNSIWLAKNQGLTERELFGVLLHEMCHHVVFEKYGCEGIEAHGSEWKFEMRSVGFEDPEAKTDGCSFFSEEQYQELLLECEKEKSKST